MGKKIKIEKKRGVGKKIKLHGTLYTPDVFTWEYCL